MTADLPTVPDHVLLVRVMRWALANGWMQQWRGWTSPDRTVAVHPHGRGVTGLVTVYCRDNARDPWDAYSAGPWRELAVRSVTEAVDWLVLCGVLPVTFSSAFAAGQAAKHAELTACTTVRNVAEDGPAVWVPCVARHGVGLFGAHAFVPVAADGEVAL